MTNIRVSEAVSFSVTCGELMVSDPCYGNDQAWCSGALPAENGAWQGRVVYDDDEEGIVKLLWTGLGETRNESWFKTLTARKLVKAGFISAEFQAGVDSGQVGIYDKVLYGRNCEGKPRAKPKSTFDVFYEQVCNTTIDERSLFRGEGPGKQFGTTLSVVEPVGEVFGVVSRTGYGDGGYPCFFVPDPVSGRANEVIVKFF